jgi:hypothetical protein
MSTDYRVIQYRSLSRVTELGLYSSSPKTLDVRGTNFVDVVAVHINDTPSPEFIVLSSTRILAQVPRTQVTAEIKSIQVFTASGDMSVSISSVTLISMASGPPVQGQAKMVQSFLKRFLTTPGKDIFSPTAGGGALQLIGRVGREDLLKAAALTAVSATQEQEIGAQSGNPRLLPDERLRSASLLSANFSPNNGSLSLRIRLVSVGGTSTDAALSL